jgi:hypothetical protein
MLAAMTTIIAVFACRKPASEFEATGKFVQRNRVELAAIIADIQKQDELKRIIWSDGREFFTVIHRDGRIVEGYASGNQWQSQTREWIERLKGSGSHGFDDDRIGGLTILFLDASTFVAVPTAESSEDEYSAWAKVGKTQEGMRCVDLGRGWYLTTTKN